MLEGTSVVLLGISIVSESATVVWMPASIDNKPKAQRQANIFNFSVTMHLHKKVEIKVFDSVANFMAAKNASMAANF
jgi:hypothetical protein